MTDPRIEAAVSEWMRQIDKISLEKTGRPAKWTDPEILSGIRNAMTASLAAADAAAWRPIATAPRGEKIIIGHPNYAIPGYRNSDWSKPEWLDLFFSISSPSIPLFPQPTHWQPLPAPPKAEVTE